VSHKILIVEDNDDARIMLKRMLELEGYDVFQAVDGYEAVEQTQEKHPDLILMDMALPGMDGLSATREIRKTENVSDIPVIGVTAHGHFYNDKAIAAGCDAVISKPISHQLLNTMVSLYL